MAFSDTAWKGSFYLSQALAGQQAIFILALDDVSVDMTVLFITELRFRSLVSYFTSDTALCSESVKDFSSEPLFAAVAMASLSVYGFSTKRSQIFLY